LGSRFRLRHTRLDEVRNLLFQVGLDIFRRFTPHPLPLDRPRKPSHDCASLMTREIPLSIR
jgi:hypothetical protein